MFQSKCLSGSESSVLFSPPSIVRDMLVDSAEDSYTHTSPHMRLSSPPKVTVLSFSFPARSSKCTCLFYSLSSSMMFAFKWDFYFKHRFSQWDTKTVAARLHCFCKKRFTKQKVVLCTNIWVRYIVSLNADLF